jgi:LPXTG-site transpeptidase (sortase) family protein
MTRRTASIVMAVSVVVLLAAGVWFLMGRSDPSSDLIGAPATTTTVSSTTTAVPSTAAAPTTAPTTTLAPPAEPVTLTIPSLGVDAPVVPVGLEPSGEMEVPPATEAGWYLHGPRPGAAAGTAVIAAHVDYGGQRGVFFDLRSLQVGSEVTVDDVAGARHRYVVTERYQVDKDELPIEQIFVAGGEPGLTLITCGGVFDRGVRSYEDNIVVRAVPV